MTTILDWMTTNQVRLDNLFKNKCKPIPAKDTLPEKVFLMLLMSLCHKPFVYGASASDIKWHYRGKSDIKQQITPIFSDLLPNMQYMHRYFFVYDGLHSSSGALYFAIWLIIISIIISINSGICHQPYSCSFIDKLFLYQRWVIFFFTLGNSIA